MPGITSRKRAAGSETGAGRPFVSGIILAAGLSRRMGSPKQLLHLGERTLLEAAIGPAVASNLDEVLVVLGHRAEEISSSLEGMDSRGFRTLVAAGYQGGLKHSIRAGLAATSPRSQAAAILLGDQPKIETSLIDRVLATWAGERSRILRPLYSSPGYDPIPGHPLILARSIWPEFVTLEGEGGVRDLIQLHPDWLEVIPIEGKAPLDIDTPADHARMERLLKNRESASIEIERT